jgi:hypothetical protein
MASVNAAMATSRLPASAFFRAATQLATFSYPVDIGGGGNESARTARKRTIRKAAAKTMNILDLVYTRKRKTASTGNR